MSSYWWPALLGPDGRVLTPVYSDHYYKASHYDLNDYTNGGGRIVAPPRGLKIVAGDMTARGPTQNEFYFNFTCGDSGSSRSQTIPNCPNVTLNVHFPQCNDGRLDSPDHKAHMSYPVGGECPSTHPNLIPSISYHIHYENVPAGSRLSSDAATGPAGYSLHADIIVNWDETVLQGMVTGCISAGLSGGSHLTCEGREMFGGI